MLITQEIHAHQCKHHYKIIWKKSKSFDFKNFHIKTKNKFKTLQQSKTLTIPNETHHNINVNIRTFIELIKVTAHF